MASPTAANDPQIALLRHALATVAYRAGKALRGAPPEFAAFKAGPNTPCTPAEILAHLGDLYDWALTQCEGHQAWRETPPTDWNSPTPQRFFIALEKVDAYLVSGAPLGMPPTQLFQGAVADSLTHIGQINILRGIAGALHPPRKLLPRQNLRRPSLRRPSPSRHGILNSWHRHSCLWAPAFLTGARSSHFSFPNNLLLQPHTSQ